MKLTLSREEERERRSTFDFKLPSEEMMVNLVILTKERTVYLVQLFHDREKRNEVNRHAAAPKSIWTLTVSHT